MSTVSLKPLSTAKGSSTRGGIININGVELLFSYNTLVGVDLGNGPFIQRDGLAGSRTTARHINRWLDGRTAKKVSEAELLELAAYV